MATYYINADTGDDTTGDGSQGNPWLTMSKANSSSTSGDTIFCQNSTNTYIWETLTFGSNARNIIGQSTDGVVFDAGNIDIGDGWRFYSAFFEVRNITFTGINTTDVRNGGFYINQFGVGSVDFYNCIFHDNTPSSGQGGLFTCYSNNQAVNIDTISLNGCLFYNHHRNVFGRTGARFNIYLNNTTFYFNAITDLVVNITGGYGGTQAGIYCKNSIFANVQGNTISLNDAPNVSSRTTLSYCCTSGGFQYYTDTENNFIDTDPLLIDPDNNNYNLSPSSPCIDAGTLI